MSRSVLYIAWLIALAGMGVSLFYGEVLGYEPCRLCWYQRIALFPLALLLGIALLREDVHFAPYGIALALVGEFFAIYHLLEIHFPSFRSEALCGPVHSCHEAVIELFGISFPALSALGFLLILAALLISQRRAGS